MHLYLVQHGEALAPEVDPDRPLSDAGRADAERLAGYLAGRGVRVARVLHSGKTRARQTAEILARALAPEATVEAREGLAPNDPAASFAAQAAEWDQDSLVVGHLPFLGRLVARLVAGTEERPVVAFVPGTIVCLERAEAGAWRVAWMLRPEVVP